MQNGSWLIQWKNSPVLMRKWLWNYKRKKEMRFAKMIGISWNGYIHTINGIMSINYMYCHYT